MKNQDYQKSFSTNVSAGEAFKSIIGVGTWWTDSFKGSAEKVNDVFKVTMGDTYVEFEVVESLPGKKLVWLVTDCNLHWLTDKKEWKGTKLIWEITEKNGATTILMTHEGLSPEVECYNDCKLGWDQYIGISLPQLLSTGKGLIYEASRAKAVR